MFLILLSCIIPLLVFLVKYNYNYWNRLGFPQDEETSIPMGCLGSVAKRATSAAQCIYRVYTKTIGDYVGIYLFFKPSLLIRNVDLARDIMIKSFANFHDRGVYDGGKKDPINSNLFSQHGKDWVDMRKKISPSFTTGKIKAILGTSNDVAHKLVDYLKARIPDNEVKEFEMKEVYSTYAIEIIASIVFGLDINGFENPKNRFSDVISDFNANTNTNLVNSTVSFLIPKLVPLIRLLGVRPKGIYLLKDLMEEVIDARKKNGTVRKDILQLLLQLQATGEINADDDNWSIKSNANSTIDHFSLESITAQSFLFYFAGQETTGGTSSFALAELAMNPHILKKLQNEIDDVLQKHNGEFTYEALHEMQYLDLCIKETLRKYPGLPILNRICVEDYAIPGTDKVIKKGTSIIIPVLGYHMDPANYPNPDEFIPERFIGETHKSYMPFGEGPRKCIAARLGAINVKLGVAHVLHAFNVEPMEKTTFEPEPQSVTLLPKGGVKIKLSRRQKK